MKSNKVVKTIIPFVFLFLFNMPCYAQQLGEDPDDTEDGEDAELNPVPIEDYIVPMLVLGIATAFILLRKKEVKSAS